MRSTLLMLCCLALSGSWVGAAPPPEAWVLIVNGKSMGTYKAIRSPDLPDVTEEKLGTENFMPKLVGNGRKKTMEVEMLGGKVNPELANSIREHSGLQSVELEFCGRREVHDMASKTVSSGYIVFHLRKAFVAKENIEGGKENVTLTFEEMSRSILGSPPSECR